jgi:hypothetical protein
MNPTPEPGFVYVLFNPSLNGLVKIGRSSRDPEDRAVELSSTTACPTPFVVAYDAYFADACAVERFIHERLTEKGFRKASNREFFQMPVAEAVKTVVAAQAIFDLARPDAVGPCVQDAHGLDALADICQLAEALYDGKGDVLEDHDRAIELYRTAAKAGSGRGLFGLAWAWLREDPRVEWGEIRPLLQNAMERGFVEASAYFAVGMVRANHEANARKCWDRFFEDFHLFDEESRVVWGMRYVTHTPVDDVTDNHREALNPYRDQIRTRFEHNPYSRVKLELMLFPEIKYPVQIGQVVAVGAHNIAVSSGDGIFSGHKTEVKLGTSLRVGQSVKFIRNPLASPLIACAIDAANR